MQTIDLSTSSESANASALKNALETYATDYFSSVTISESTVSCYVDGTLWLTIRANYARFECVGNTQNCEFVAFTDTYFTKLHIFDNAIVFEAAHPIRSFVLTKNKAGAVTLLAANVSYDSGSNKVTSVNSNVNTSNIRVFAAMSVGNDVMVYTGYRQYVIGGKVFGVPISTGDSSTENVLQSVISAFSDQLNPHQIIVDGESWYAIVYDSIYIKST